MYAFCGCEGCVSARISDSATLLDDELEYESDEYSLIGTRWAVDNSVHQVGSTVTWSIASLNYAADYISFSSFITTQQAIAVIQAAFDAWEAVTNIDFVKVSDSSNVDVRLGYGTLGGQGGTLGIANYSYGSGQILNEAFVRFDIAESWDYTLNSSGAGPSFYVTALHEIGHTIGLAHSFNSSAVMAPTLNGSLTGLTSDDIAGIQAIYGAPGSSGGGGNPPDDGGDPPDSGGNPPTNPGGTPPPDVNHAPTNIRLSKTELAENSVGGYIVGRLRAVDSDFGDTHDFEILDDQSGGSAALFSITGNALRVADDAEIDFESQNEHALFIRATDAGGLSIEQQIIVTVTDVGVTDISFESGGLVQEDAAEGTIVASLTAMEGLKNEPGAAFLLLDDANGRFVLDGHELKVAAGALFDFETSASHSVTVSVPGDGGTEDFSKQLSILVGDVDISSIVIAAGGEVLEDAVAGTAVATLIAMEGQKAEPAAVFTLLDDAGGQFVLVGNEIKVANGAVFEDETQDSYTVTLGASDGEGALYSEEFTIQIIGVAEKEILGTPEPDFLEGNSADNTILAFASDDTIVGSAGSDLIDGGENLDTVIYQGLRENYHQLVTPDGAIIVDKPGSDTDTLRSIERIELDDGTFLFDIDSPYLGFGYRIYQAGLGRVPEEEGLRFWIESLDDLVPDIGYASAQNHLATEFIQSDEFADLFGTDPSDIEYVDGMYVNVLGRLPDDAGRAFWVDAMLNGLSREDTLIQFTESDENIAANAANLDNGIWVA